MTNYHSFADINYKLPKQLKTNQNFKTENNYDLEKFLIKNDTNFSFNKLDLPFKNKTEKTPGGNENNIDLEFPNDISKIEQKNEEQQNYENISSFSPKQRSHDSDVKVNTIDKKIEGITSLDKSKSISPKKQIDKKHIKLDIKLSDSNCVEIKEEIEPISRFPTAREKIDFPQMSKADSFNNMSSGPLMARRNYTSRDMNPRENSPFSSAKECEILKPSIVLFNNIYTKKMHAKKEAKY